MDMSQVNFGGEGFFGAMPQKNGGVSVDGCGLVPEKPVHLDGFAGCATEQQSTGKSVDFALLLAQVSVTQDASNSEAAFSVNQLVSGESVSLVNKLDALSDIDSLLKRVGELLGLNIDMEKSLNVVDPEEIPDEIVSQLADFMAGLKEFTQLLQITAKSGESVEIGGQEMSGVQVQGVADQLNQEIVRLEMQTTTLGISGKMAAKMALQKLDLSTVGVQFAVNPSDLAGTQKIPATLASLFQKEESELEGMIASIRQLASQAGKKDAVKSLTDLAKTGEPTKEIISGQSGETAKSALAEQAVKGTENGNEIVPVQIVDAGKKVTVSAVVQEAVKQATPVETAIIQPAQQVQTSAVSPDSSVQQNNAETDLELSPELAKLVSSVKVEKGVHSTHEKHAAQSAPQSADSDDAKVSAKSLLAELAAATNSGETDSGAEQDSSESDEGSSETVVSQADSVKSFETALREQRDLSDTGISLESKVQTADAVSVQVKAERVHTPRTFEQIVMDQISGKMTQGVKEGVREVTLVLKPELLGEVKVTLQVHGDVVHAKLQVESQQVKQIVETHLQNLKDALTEHNLKAGSIDVNVGNGEQHRKTEQQVAQKKRKSEIPGTIEEFENDPFVPDVFGKETGRRYGSNSVEYFA